MFYNYNILMWMGKFVRVKKHKNAGNIKDY